MGIWFLTARRRWSIRSMAMSNGAAAPGNTTRQRQLTLIGLLTAITFDDAAPLTDSCDGSAGRGTARGGTRAKRGEVLEDFEAVMCLDVLRLGFATAALRG